MKVSIPETKFITKDLKKICLKFAIQITFGVYLPPQNK